jgi:hypothetical protein
MKQIELMDPQDLKKRLHPALKRIPVLDDASQEAIRAAIMQTGSITDPIKLDADGRVATDHGRTLVLAACDLGLSEIAVQMTDLDAATLILDELTTRRHLTKSAIAYLAYPLLKPAWEAARIRQAACLKKGAKTPDFPVLHSADYGARTVEDFAKERGLGQTYLFEAQKVHQLFEEFESRRFKFTIQGGKHDGEIAELTLREYFEPRIIRQPIGGEHEQNRPMGLGAVVAAIGYVISGKNFTGAARPQYQFEQFEFWVKPIGSLQDGFRHWKKMPEKTRKLCVKLWAATLNGLPEELWDITIQQAERRLRNQ